MSFQSTRNILDDVRSFDEHVITLVITATSEPSPRMDSRVRSYRLRSFRARSNSTKLSSNSGKSLELNRPTKSRANRPEGPRRQERSIKVSKRQFTRTIPLPTTASGFLTTATPLRTVPRWRELQLELPRFFRVHVPIAVTVIVSGRIAARIASTAPAASTATTRGVRPTRIVSSVI